MFKLFKNFNKRDFLFIFIIFCLVVTSVWLELKMPDYMSAITRLVETEGSEMKDILEQGLYMLICALGSLVCAIIIGYLSAKVASNFSQTLRFKIFVKVQKFGIEEMKKFKTSSLITRTTNDVTQIEMLIAMGMQLMMRSPIMAVWAITKILDKSIEWSMLTGACVVILLVTIGILMSIVIPRFKKIQKLIFK